MTGKTLSKKSQQIPYLVIGGMFLAFIVFLSFAAMKKPDVKQAYIGENQLAILKTAEKAEMALLYVDQAARIAVGIGIIQLAEIGGVYSSEDEPSECGDYYGYSLWQSFKDGSLKKCYPGYISDRIKRFIEAALGDSFSKYKSTELRDYDVNYDINIDDNNIMGIASNPLDFKIVVEKIREVPKEGEIAAGELAEVDAAGVNIGGENLVPIPDVGGVKVCFAKDCRLKKSAADTIPAMYRMMKENGCELHINSAYRSEEDYRENWYGIGAKKYSNEMIRRTFYCGPKDGTFSHCPHILGGALDIDTSSCPYEKRIMIMCTLGWINYHNERWHFEYGTTHWKNALSNGLCQWPAVAKVGDSRGEFSAGHAAIRRDSITDAVPIDVTQSIEPVIDTTKISSGEQKIVDKVNQYDSIIRMYGGKYGIAPNVVKAMISHESGGDPNAISYTGCVGLGQFCYSTAEGSSYSNIFGKVTSCSCGPGKSACKDYHECTPENDGRFNPEKSIEATAKYLAGSYKSYAGNIYMISISYNAGPGVANIVKDKLGDKPGTYENIRPLIDEAVLKYFSASKINEVDQHMRGVARYYSIYGGKSEIEMQTEITPSGELKTYIVRTIGKYSVYPSFSVDLGYSINEYSIIKQQIQGYGNNKGVLDLAADCEKKSEETGKKLGECVSDAIKAVNGREEMKNSKLVMFNGPCDPKENLWSDFVEDFGDCIENEQDSCYCEITLDQSEQSDFKDKIRIKAEKTDQATNIMLDDQKNPLSYSSDKAIEETKAFDISKTNSVYYAVKSNDKVLLSDKKPEISKCNIEKRKFKLCVQSDKKILYYDDARKNTENRNIEYKFAVELPDIMSPAPVTGFLIKDRPKSEESLLLRWNKNTEQDVGKYMIYFAKSEFNVFAPNIELNTIKQRTELNSVEISLADTKTIMLDSNLNLDSCSIKDKKCYFDDGKTGIVLEPGKLYNLKTAADDYYVYVLEKKSYEPYSSLIEDGVEYDFAITAVDVYRNEVNNIDTKQKLPVVKSTKSVDDLKPQKLIITGISSVKDAVSITFAEPTENEDGSKLVDWRINQAKIYLYFDPVYFSEAKDQPTLYIDSWDCENSVCSITTADFGMGYYGLVAADEAGNMNELLEPISKQ